MEEDSKGTTMGNVIRDDERVRKHLGRIVRGTVEETLNAMLEAKADRLCNAGRYERTELEYVPSHFKRVVHVRPKMSCRGCETVADAADREGASGPGAARPCGRVEVLRSSPAASQADIYARSGVEIDRAVMAGWIGRLAGLLEPLSERIERHARAGLALHADNAPVPVLDPGKGKTKTGRLDGGARRTPVRRDGRGPPPSIPTRPTVRRSTRGRCSPAVGAPSTPTATPASPIFTNPSRRPAVPA
jgi:transposase